MNARRMVTYSEVLLSILMILTATITSNVFYWVPVIGSTIAYGIDPFKFFLKCKAEVGLSESDP